MEGDISAGCVVYIECPPVFSPFIFLTLFLVHKYFRAMLKFYDLSSVQTGNPKRVDSKDLV